jgi:hypothetical protein
MNYYDGSSKMKKTVTGIVGLLGLAGFMALGPGLTAEDRLQNARSTSTTLSAKTIRVSSNEDQLYELVASIQVAQDRIAELENQLANHQSFLAVLQDHITIDGSGKLAIEAMEIDLTAWSEVSISSSHFNVSSSHTDFDSATADFSGVVSSEVVQTKSVISSSYTPGAGNVL